MTFEPNLNAIDGALIKAAWLGDEEMLDKALAEGANVNVSNGGALRRAAKQGYDHIVRKLIRKKADIHIYADMAVSSAASAGFVDTVALFLDADPHAKWPASLIGDAKENAGVMAFLFERNIGKGADLSEYDADSYHAMRLCLAAPAIRQAIAKLPATEQIYAGKLAWQQAAIATELRQSTEAIIAAAQKALTRNPIPTPRHSFKETAQRCGLRGYKATADARVMAEEYAKAILLPALLLEVGIKGNDEKLECIENGDFADLRELLIPIAGHILFAGKTLEETLQLVNAYKRGGNAIPDTLRPLAAGKWQPIIDKIETPFFYDTMPVTIEALSTPAAIDEEGRRMNNCLENSNYASNCYMGAYHILSIRAGEKSLATCTATIANRDSPMTLLSQGPGEGETPRVAEQVKEWFLNGLSEGYCTLNAPEDGYWGKLRAEKNKVLPIIRYIGYYPDESHVQKCLQHYHDHLLLKEDTGVRGGPASQKNYAWRHAVDNQPVQKIVEKAGMLPAWQQLVENMQRQLGITPVRTAMQK